MSDGKRSESPAVSALAFADLAAKLGLLAFVTLVAMDPTWGNLEGKAPTQRAVLYPLVAAIVPVMYRLRSTPRGPYPWLPDLLLTFIGFSDILGNRLDLYDDVVWFDDWMHFWNAVLIGSAVLVLTTARGIRFGALLERAIAVALTVSLAWELWEYFSFVTESREAPHAYADTIGDFSLAWLGAVTGVVVVWLARRLAPNRGTNDSVPSSPSGEASTGARVAGRTGDRQSPSGVVRGRGE